VKKKRIRRFKMDFRLLFRKIVRSRKKDEYSYRKVNSKTKNCIFKKIYKRIKTGTKRGIDKSRNFAKKATSYTTQGEVYNALNKTKKRLLESLFLFFNNLYIIQNDSNNNS
jgi:hypothetical protein